MRNIVQTYELTPADRSFLVMPLFHVHGLLAGFLAPLLSGGSVVIPPKFSAGTFWAEFVATGSNWYTVSRTRLLDTPRSFVLKEKYTGRSYHSPNFGSDAVSEPHSQHPIHSLVLERTVAYDLCSGNFLAHATSLPSRSNILSFQLEAAFKAPVLEAYAMVPTKSLPPYPESSLTTLSFFRRKRPIKVCALVRKPPSPFSLTLFSLQ